MDQQDHGVTLGLHDYVGIVRRRWIWIAGFTLFTIMLTALVTFRQTPLYQSSVEVLIEPLRGGSTLEQALFGRGTMSTQTRLITSVTTADEVAGRLELEIPPRELLAKVAASTVGDTTVLRIEATDPDPQVAATIAQGFADTYLALRRDQAMEQLEDSTAELAERIQVIRDRIQALDVELARRDAEAEAEADSSDGGAPSPTPSQESSTTALTRERDTLLTQLGQLTAQTSSLTTASSLQGGGEVLVPAVASTDPVSPRPLRNLALATVLGLTLGFGLAFVRDYYDDALRTDEQVRSALHGRPVLGHLPHVENAGGHPPLPTLREPTSPAAEAARTLRTNLRFISVDDRLASLTITSSVEGEGKTTIAANLAVAASLLGARVLLVDADLRRPNVHKTFGVDNTFGLSELLTDQAELLDVVRDIGIRNLRLITAGTRPPNPSELLSSNAFARTVETLEGLADVVIFDAPPVLPVSDALEVAHWTSGAVLVVRAGQSGRRALRDATERLVGTGADVLGGVVNGIHHGGGYHYYYTYMYGYGQTDAERDNRREKMAHAPLTPSRRGPSTKIPAAAFWDTPAHGSDGDDAADEGASIDPVSFLR